MIDSHCHLNYIEKNGSPASLVKKADEAGVHTIINIGTDLESSILSIEYSKQCKSVYATVGIHPHDAKTVDKLILDELEELTYDPKVVAVGEIGLDFYRNHSPRDVQIKVFRQQLELAIKTKLPVVIHSRESFDETVNILKEYRSKLSGGVFHCFPGDVNEAYKVIELGFVVSVGGVITFGNNKMAQVATEIPLDKIILETDAPYLTPIPHRGKTNCPEFVKYVYQHLANLRQISIEEVESTVDRNAQKLFSLVETFGG
jgi:TatD DNase family protein